jgi:hypothetical protein
MTPLPALGGIAVILGSILGWELMPPVDDAPEIAAARAAPIKTAEAAGPGLGILSDLGATVLARPLFSPDRRLAPPGAPAQVADIAEALPRLAAVIVGPHGGLAIFEDGSGRPRIAAEGDTVGHFKVGAIAPGQVSLIASEGERVLRPKYAAAGGTSVAQTIGPAGSHQ